MHGAGASTSSARRAWTVAVGSHSIWISTEPSVGHRVPEVDTTQDKGAGRYKIVHKTEAKDMWCRPPKRGGDGSIMSRTEKAKMLVSLSLTAHHII
ncbi:MAG: hypothetical protein IKQ60_00110 [Candidatus Methanomethylophilaceae archaeon]|nr:hypothetical protein [Candidatus Methanomethylophilaceae archaeon]